jgi:hypothetical protein
MSAGFREWLVSGTPFRAGNWDGVTSFLIVKYFHIVVADWIFR